MTGILWLRCHKLRALSYIGFWTNMPHSRSCGAALMRPRLLAAEAEILGIGLAHRGARLRLGQAIGNAVALRVGDRLLLAGEGESQLGSHIARAGPTH